jgi:hypothetical protein
MQQAPRAQDASRGACNSHEFSAMTQRLILACSAKLSPRRQTTNWTSPRTGFVHLGALVE